MTTPHLYLDLEATPPPMALWDAMVRFGPAVDADLRAETSIASLLRIVDELGAVNGDQSAPVYERLISSLRNKVTTSLAIHLNDMCSERLVHHWERLAVNPWKARPVCCSFALDNGDVWTVTTVEEVAEVLYQHRDSIWVMHRAEYDLQLVLAWLLRSGSRGGAAKAAVARMTDSHPTRRLVDTKVYMNRLGPSLNGLCEIMGVAAKTDDIGATVYQVWATDPDRVIRYNQGDVVAMRAAHQELMKVGLGLVKGATYAAH